MYTIKKSTIINNINDPVWKSAKDIKIETINWEEFAFKPNMIAKLLYSDFGLHIKLTTDEKNLIATKRKQNEQVCEDSCMEFFFRPNENNPHYINFEFNPFGTMYSAIRTSRKDAHYPVENKYYFNVISDVTENEWSLFFTVPFEFIDKNFGGHTDKIYGNIYKCGGQTEHYLSLFPISSENPDFHRPEFFGEFILEK